MEEEIVRAPSLRESQGWQPIESAPRKFGEFILACTAGEEGVALVHWATPEPFGETATWTTASEGPGYSTSYDEGKLTHWMPLPNPPGDHHD